MDVIEPVTASEWISPIVVARKKDGKIRLCVDLRGSNKAVVVDAFPLPTMDELLYQLAGAKVFSKLDLTAAYHQVVLAPESRDLTAFITHRGLYRYKRVCFGLASAPSAFQKMFDLFKDCPGVKCYLDDIIVFGVNEQDHLKNLHRVLQLISNAGLKLNDKCVFGVRELTFVGHTVRPNGISPNFANLQAIQDAATPDDKKTLSSFLRMMSYYAKFIKNYADEVEPLRELLRGDAPFLWTEERQIAFNRLKSLLMESTALALFHPDLPITVSTDASAYGLGAVLQQQHGSYLETDHQALQVLLSRQGTGHRPLRTTRWCMRLLDYTFDVVYKKGKQNVIADALSRLPAPLAAPSIQESLQDEDEIICWIDSTGSGILSRQDLQAESYADPLLAQILKFIQQGWPSRNTMSQNLSAFGQVKDELSEVDGLLLRQDRIVVPPSLRPKVIALAHESHLGIVRTKQRIRQYYWWPAMDADVESSVRNCLICQSAGKSAKTCSPPLQPIPFPDGPWEKIGIDIVGPVHRAPQSSKFIISVMDYYIEKDTPQRLYLITGRNLLHRTSEFLNDRGIKHTYSSVYHFQSNGLIERFNRVLKSFIQVAILEKRSLEAALTDYLGEYRATPHTTTGYSPAVLLHGRALRTRLNVVGLPIPDFHVDPVVALQKLREKILKKQLATKKYVDNKRAAHVVTLKVGDFVRVKQPTHVTKGDRLFSTPRMIVASQGNSSFLLDDGKVWNASRLSKVSREASHKYRKNVHHQDEVHWSSIDPPQLSTLPVSNDREASTVDPPLEPVTSTSTQEPQAKRQEPLRRGSRERRPPQRLRY
ncbi:uncharacterized protein K02A2.6-like [Ornithodoros turicata]|uniref:uncharacterized protein K02A2.6-like n=1 Tax=Ornithodoros turicata TaxID=34597 RepID=UPI00313964A8